MYVVVLVCVLCCLLFFDMICGALFCVVVVRCVCGLVVVLVLVLVGCVSVWCVLGWFGCYVVCCWVMFVVLSVCVGLMCFASFRCVCVGL